MYLTRWCGHQRHKSAAPSNNATGEYLECQVQLTSSPANINHREFTPANVFLLSSSFHCMNIDGMHRLWCSTGMFHLFHVIACRGNYVGMRPYQSGRSCSACPMGKRCVSNLCTNWESVMTTTPTASTLPLQGVCFLSFLLICSLNSLPPIVQTLSGQCHHVAFFE